MQFWHLFRMKGKRADTASLPWGESEVCIPEGSGVTADMLSVYCYRPPSWMPEDPLWIAFHGYDRDGLALCRALTPLAETWGFFLACPTFTEEKYPGAAYYQTGHVLAENGGGICPLTDRTFSAVNHVTAELKRRTAARGDMVLFGHSAGAQFLQRASLLAELDAHRIVMANSGWFTMPDDRTDYPYGLGGTDVGEEALRRAFSLPVLILVGEDDIKREYPFRKTAEADAQGRHRKERNIRYFQECKTRAENMGTPFLWQYKEVSGVGHEAVPMAQAAAAWLCGKRT